MMQTAQDAVQATLDSTVNKVSASQNPLTVVKRYLQIESAGEFKDHIEKQIELLQKDMEALAGKDRQKERAEKGRAVRELRASHRYIDACRVLKGARPQHGHFVKEAEAREEGGKSDENEAEASQRTSFEDAAQVHEEVEKQLAELSSDEPHETVQHEEGSLEEIFAENPRKLLSGWAERILDLEDKAAKRRVPATDEDRNSLEAVAQEVVWYREKLVKDCGYRKKDLAEDPDLSNLEARLDKLAEFFLADNDDEVGERPAVTVSREEDVLRAWGQDLMARLATLTQSTAGLSPSGTKEAEQLMKEISEVKARMGAEGLPDHEQDRHEEVWLRIVRLMELRQREFHDKKHDCRELQEHKDLREEVQRLHSKIQDHKRRLRDELGFSAKEARKDAGVQELEERFKALCEMGGA